MKKLIYTFSFATLLGLAAKSQTVNESAKQDGAKQSTPAAVLVATESANEKTQKAPAPVSEPKSGTRMAINEKGVPASKAAKDKSKEEKAQINPGQPATADKK